MSDYPRISAPKRQPDKTYAVEIRRARGDKKSVSYATKAAAENGVKALEAAKGLLFPTRRQFGKIGTVRGPRREGDHWQVRWEEDGRERYGYGTSQEMADLARELRGVKKDHRGPRLPKRAKPGTPEWFKACLLDALEANRQSVEALDHEGMKATRSRLTALSEAAKTAEVVGQYAELQESFDKVLEYLETNQHLVEREGVEGLCPASPQLAEALQGAYGPWDPARGFRDPIPHRGRGEQGENN